MTAPTDPSTAQGPAAGGAGPSSTPPAIPPSDPNRSRSDPAGPDDFNRLDQLLSDLETILGDLIEHPRPAVPGRHHRTLREAWIGTDELRRDLHERLRGWDPNVAPELGRVGLGGRDLRFKLEVFANARDELLDFGLAKEGDKTDLAWWERWIPHCQAVLRAGGVVVTSLAKVFSWAEPLNEFLGGTDAALDLGSKVIAKWRQWWRKN
jgi:hypothetical protein